MTGEKLEAGTLITEEIAVQLQNAAVPYVMVEHEEHVTKVLSNLMVDLRYYIPDVDPKSIGVTKDVSYPLLTQILEENESTEDIIEEIQYNTY